jgi:hypothetical protein
MMQLTASLTKETELENMNDSLYPLLFQINTRVLLTEISEQIGRSATLDDIPEATLDRLAEFGFHWIWLLSVWQTGPIGQHVSRNNPEWRITIRGRTIPRRNQ